MRKLVLAAATICLVGALAAGIFWVFVLPALEWSSMVQNLVSHAQTLEITDYVRKVTIDRGHPQFQTVIDFISRSRFVRKWDVVPPYPISHTLTFYLDNGQRIRLSYDDGSSHLWWKGIYQASVDKEFVKVLDAILSS
ncbi:MAG: hypothetical protein QXN87_06235 [Candidatus Bathyarchaeia archaeon]